MADRAQVTSVAAIEAFRSHLIIYLTKARPTLEEVSNEVSRLRQWLQTDHRRHWEQQLRMRQKVLERAQNELFSATLSQLQEASAAQHLAVRRAQAAVREADDKLRLLKKWDRELEHRAEPMVKHVDQFQHQIATQIPKAVAHLAELVKTLEDYAGVLQPGASPAPLPEIPSEGLPGGPPAASEPES